MVTYLLNGYNYWEEDALWYKLTVSLSSVFPGEEEREPVVLLSSFLLIHVYEPRHVIFNNVAF